MSGNRRIDSLILLVGSNPLPNYLAAMALRPSKIHLVHSGETKGPKDRLHVALSEDLGESATIDGDAFVDDPFSASVVGAKVHDLIAKCNAAHLHYTGGTKVMSAHALKAFYENGGRPEDASYLDEAQARLRFDGNLPSRSLSEYGVTLTLDRILQLHGVTQKTRSPVDGGPGQGDVQSIATAVFQRPQLASCLYGERKRLEDGSFSDAKATPCNTNDYGLAFSASVIPAEGMSKKCYEAWRDFIGGEWLEDWIAAKVRAIGLVNDPEITVGVNCTRDGTNRPFEVDVAVICAQRSYFISCTTDMTRSLCKSKAFEILVRSRHMGGDLARSALVSLLQGNVVTELQADIADAWGSANAARVFGLEDMKNWSGHYGSPNPGSLREWLES
jgi:hypothetical protein